MKDSCLYIFVVNGRLSDNILPDLNAQIQDIGPDFKYLTYITTGTGDGTRYIRLYCEFHKEDEVCFVACGGSGTVNEVAAGIIGYSRKSMAIMAYGTSNDLIKCYPGRDFRSLKKILCGKPIQIDAVKCNDEYSINVINIGFDAMAAYEANLCIENGEKNAYAKGVSKALLLNRFNRLKIVADGETLCDGLVTLCTVSNAKYCGGQFLCAPNAVLDDGLMEVCIMKAFPLMEFPYMISKYTLGKHFEDRFCRRKVIYRRSRHVEISAGGELLRIAYDGEIYASTFFTMDIVDKAVTIIMPEQDE